ncbi:MAG: hypothetical protein J7L31_06180 [Thermoplasmata archaeon]|nr:hypothetical protein [Thermoplasmata archaeon]
MKSIRLLAGAVMLAVMLISVGCVEEKEAKTFSMGEFIQIVSNYNRTILNQTKEVFYNFSSLNDNDEVIIEDVIHNLTYDSENNYTALYCITDLNNSLPFSGNITDKFQEGDHIKIDLHIVRDTFPYPYDQTWTISIQTIEEGWDRGIHTFIPISSDSITKI